MKPFRQQPCRSAGRIALGALCLLLPCLLGGCPDFRNDVVGAFETATRSIIFDQADAASVTETAGDSILDATIDLLFDQLRTDTLR